MTLARLLLVAFLGMAAGIVIGPVKEALLSILGGTAVAIAGQLIWLLWLRFRHDHPRADPRDGEPDGV